MIGDRSDNTPGAPAPTVRPTGGLRAPSLRVAIPWLLSLVHAVGAAQAQSAPIANLEHQTIAVEPTPGEPTSARATDAIDALGPHADAVLPPATTSTSSIAPAGTLEPEARPLGKRATPTRSDPAAGATTPNDGWIVRTGGALAIVAALIFGLRWVLVRAARAGGGGLFTQLGVGGRAPSGLLEVIGRYPVARGQTLVLLRMDQRVLLLSQGSAGFSTLAEITEPEEVASMLVKARDDEGESLSVKFQKMLRGFERDPAIAGEMVGDVEVIGPATVRSAARRGLFTLSTDDDPSEAIRRRIERLREQQA